VNKKKGKGSPYSIIIRVPELIPVLGYRATLQKMKLAAVQATDERPIAPPHLRQISVHTAVSSLGQKDDRYTHTRVYGPFLGLPGSAGTRKVKPMWILLKQEIVSGSGISWAICKSAARCRQITTPVPHHSVFYTSDALPTVSKH